MIRTVLFDLDGTLTDSREGIVNSVKYAIEKLGGTMPDQQTLLKFIGPPLQESFMAYCGYDTETAARGVEVFRERYEPVGQYENQPAPGLRELLARLKERGYTLALASSKPEKLCLSICERFGFTQSLQTIVGSPIGADWQKADVIREVMRRLGLAEADKTSMLMVGDRKYDALGAAECGLPCVGVEFFGYAAPGELAQAGAAAVVYGSMIPYSAMAYDQRSRWDKFTRMLPYSDQAAVMSRYVLGWIFILASAAIVMLSQGILSQLSIPLAFFSALPLRILFVALCIGCLLLALNIPLMLRFGAEKARLVSALTTFLVFASAGALSGLADAESTAPVMLALPVLAVLAIIATAVSIPLSLKIYREGY